jgi:hypothetical protein
MRLSIRRSAAAFRFLALILCAATGCQPRTSPAPQPSSADTPTAARPAAASPETTASHPADDAPAAMPHNLPGRSAANNAPAAPLAAEPPLGTAGPGENASPAASTVVEHAQPDAGNRVDRGDSARLASRPPAGNSSNDTSAHASGTAPPPAPAGARSDTPTPQQSADNAAPNNGAVSRSKPPPADRTPRRPGEAEKITFEDLNLGLQPDVVFRPFMLSDRVRELEGKRVSLVGYMHPGVASARGIHEFVLLRNKECKFGPGGQADHLAQVYLRKGETTNFTPGAVKVEGTLRIEPFQGPDGNTWSIYRMEDAQIR